MPRHLHYNRPHYVAVGVTVDGPVADGDALWVLVGRACQPGRAREDQRHGRGDDCELSLSTPQQTTMRRSWAA